VEPSLFCCNFSGFRALSPNITSVGGTSVQDFVGTVSLWGAARTPTRPEVMTEGDTCTRMKYNSSQPQT
jgi:hypothetical protein